MASKPSHPVTHQSSASPSRDSVEVWTIDLKTDTPFIEAAMASLPADERARAGRFRVAAARNRYLLAHSALRRLLAPKLNQTPGNISFQPGPNGKPELAGSIKQPLHFNLSHSGDLALVAISSVAPVGVDVEQIRPLANAVRLAGRFFKPSESAALSQCPASERQAAFFRVWTRKEALLKATGQGIAYGLGRFEVSCEPGGGLLAVDGNATKAQHWTLHDWCPTEGYLAAAAIERPDAQFTIQEFHFAGSWPG